MQSINKKSLIRVIMIIAVSFSLNACVGKIVGAAVDTTIEVAKVPFKVAGAAIDVASGDDDKGKKRKKRDSEDD